MSSHVGGGGGWFGEREATEKEAEHRGALEWRAAIGLVAQCPGFKVVLASSSVKSPVVPVVIVEDRLSPLRHLRPLSRIG